MVTLATHRSAVGREVKDAAGRIMGTVRQIATDRESRAARFAVVGAGCSLAIGDRPDPLSWSLLDFDPDQDAFVLPYAREELEATEDVVPA